MQVRMENARQGDSVAEHPNKHIREAIAYAQARGWRVVKAAAHSHTWGKLLCPQHDRDGCYFNVNSTPRNPEAHARRIRRAVDGCDHS